MREGPACSGSKRQAEPMGEKFVGWIHANRSSIPWRIPKKLKVSVQIRTELSFSVLKFHRKPQSLLLIEETVYIWRHGNILITLVDRFCIFLVHCSWQVFPSSGRGLGMGFQPDSKMKSMVDQEGAWGNYQLLVKHWDLSMLLNGLRKMSWLKTSPSSVLLSPKIFSVSPLRGTADQVTFVSL